jgi:hypothetical protein
MASIFLCAMVNQSCADLEIPVGAALSESWRGAAPDEPAFRQKRAFAALAEGRHPSSRRPAAVILFGGDQSRDDTRIVAAVRCQAKLIFTDQF